MFVIFLYNKYLRKPLASSCPVVYRGFPMGTSRGFLGVLVSFVRLLESSEGAVAPRAQLNAAAGSRRGSSDEEEEEFSCLCVCVAQG